MACVTKICLACAYSIQCMYKKNDTPLTVHIQNSVVRKTNRFTRKARTNAVRIQGIGLKRTLYRYRVAYRLSKNPQRIVTGS